jgi:2-methylcitrate synthase
MATEPGAGLAGVIAGHTAIATVGKEGKGLTYRGYSIHDLAEHSTFEEVAYLLIYGRLPKQPELDEYKLKLRGMRGLPAPLKTVLELIPRSTHPMDVMRTGCSMLGTLEPEGPGHDQVAVANRLTACFSAMLLYWHHFHTDGHRIDTETDDDSTAGHFLHLLHGKKPDELHRRAIDVSLILYAEHEFNASSFAARVTAGTYVDVHSCLTAALAALKGPRHGGANEDVIQMIQEIGSPERAESWARDRLQRYQSASKEERANPDLRFPGFGHAVYRVWDPRARILQKLAAEVANSRGVHGIAEIQDSVVKVVSEGLGLNPNVDYFSAGLYYSLGIPSELYTSIFATARVAGWVAHIEEQLTGGRLIRPRGEYTGPPERKLVPLAQR